MTTQVENISRWRIEWGKGVMAFFSTLFGVYAIGFIATGGAEKFLVFKTGFTPTALWNFMITAHALGGGLALAVGWLQFIKSFRKRRPKLHRAVGLLFFVSAFIGALSGLYVAFYASGGVVAISGFATLSVLWLYVLSMAFVKIKMKDFAAHERWAWRGYALIFAAVTLRFCNVVVVIAFGPEAVPTFYPYFAWVCWIPNLVAVEIFLWRREGEAGS